MFFKYIILNVKGLPDSSVGKEPACNTGNPSSIPGSGRSSGEGIGYPLQYSWASLVAQLVKNPPAMWETRIQSLGCGIGKWLKLKLQSQISKTLARLFNLFEPFFILFYFIMEGFPCGSAGKESIFYARETWVQSHFHSLSEHRPSDF